MDWAWELWDDRGVGSFWFVEEPHLTMVTLYLLVVCLFLFHIANTLGYGSPWVKATIGGSSTESQAKIGFDSWVAQDIITVIRGNNHYYVVAEVLVQ